MWAAPAAILVLKKDILIILRRLKSINFRFLPLILLIALLPYILTQIYLYSTGNGIWDNKAFSLNDISKLSFITEQLWNLHYGAFTTFFIWVLGEEIGWRGYAQKLLYGKVGVVKGSILLGILWSYWHTVANLSGVNGSENIYLITFVTFPISVTFMSIILSWIKLRTDSLWNCVYYHAISNTAAGFKFIKTEDAKLAYNVELIFTVIIGLLFLYILKKIQDKRITQGILEGH